MKKAFAFVALFALALQATAFAAVVQGTVKEVKAEEKALVLTTETEEKTVTYSEATMWDEGVTDPATLVGKPVAVTSNDETGAVEMVHEIKPVA